jgi:hypothetical protein
MKTNFFGKLLPVVVVALATFGAAGSASISPSADPVPDEQGWYHISPTEPCVASSMCNEQGTDLCTVNDLPGAQQLYRKTGETNCEFPLYRPIDQ